MVHVRFSLAAALLIAPFLAGSGGAEPSYSLLELRGVAPEWWTPEVQAAAMAAGAQGKLLNPITGEFVSPEFVSAQATAPGGGIPYGSPDYLFIRPGALMLTQGGGLCTFNFIYASGTKIGTAGHCVSFVGQNVFSLTVPAPTIPLVNYLGYVANFSNGGIGNDWALINIYGNWFPWVDPNMAYIGGPSCSTWGGGALSTTVKHVGHGIQTGLVASVPRTSVVISGSSTNFVSAGEVSGGDSGSPVVQVVADAGCSGGKAAGIVTHCLSLTGLECIPVFYSTDIRRVPATVTPGFDPL